MNAYNYDKGYYYYILSFVIQLHIISRYLAAPLRIRLRAHPVMSHAPLRVHGGARERRSVEFVQTPDL